MRIQQSILEQHNARRYILTPYTFVLNNFKVEYEIIVGIFNILYYLSLVAVPSLDFLKQKNKHVLLNDETDIKLVQLNCDIRPGRLRQNYEIMWKRIIQTGPSEGGFLHITEGINQSDFSLTLNVTKTTPIGAYQCSVRIMHTVAVTDTYLGASISLKTASECMHIAHEVKL